MIEILSQFFNIIVKFINWFFTLKIEFISGFEVSVAELGIAFAFIVIVIYLICRAFGIIGRGDDN